MSWKRFFALTCVLIAVGCSSDYGPSGNPPPPPPPPPGPNAVDVRDNLFTPKTLNVQSGATVTWTWRGSSQHNVIFEDGQGSSSLQASGTHSRSFSATGTYRYRCTEHSVDFIGGMVGDVRVQ